MKLPWAARNWSAQLRQGIQASGFEVRPLEKLRLPEALLGRDGGNRADRSLNQLAADEDVAAITAWLALSARRTPGPEEPPVTEQHIRTLPQLTHTQRAYRKEAERLLLWSTLERSKALSSLDQRDAQAYLDFLTHPVPPERWCSAQVHGRWSPLWRPFAGPLSDSSRAHTLRVLCSLFSFLVKHGYLREAIFTRTDSSLRIPSQAPATTAPKSAAKNSLPFNKVQMPVSLVSPVLPDPGVWDGNIKDGTNDIQLRLQLALSVTQAGGLRLSQLCELRLCDWQADPSEAGAWRLVQASGPTHKAPRHPVRLSANTLQWVKRYLETRGLPAHLGVPCHPDIHLIGASPRAPSLRNKPRHAPGDRIQPGTLRDQIRSWQQSR
jgi:integrase